MPKLKDMMSTQTQKRRQSWREQLVVMSEWASAVQKRKALLKELTDGR
jgi:hypothetical protein